MPAQRQNSSKSPLKIFQIFTGRWESANRRDHEGQVFKRLMSLPFENLKKCGINTLYFMGIFDSRGPLVVKEENGLDLSQKSHRCPSPFAISNHLDTDPSLGSSEEFIDLCAKAKSLGFKVVVDFVPNHTSTAHPWVETHPEYYQKKEGTFTQEFSGDVYKLDYSSKVAGEMSAIASTLINVWKIDGLRCDMAHLVPNEFWKQTIAENKKLQEECLFIAESYETSIFNWQNTQNLRKSGFDLIYHHGLFENIKQFLTMSSPWEHTQKHLAFVKEAGLDACLLNYLSNHDDSFPGSQHQIKSILGQTFNSQDSWLFYNGFLNGRTNRLAHHWIDILEDEKNEIYTPPTHLMGIISHKPTKILSLDIGGSKIESGIVDKANVVTKIKKEPTNKSDYKAFIQQLERIINTYQNEENEALVAISLAIPGIIDKNGNIAFPGGSLTFLDRRNVRDDLSDIYNIPIYIENDANCFTLGEALCGAGKQFDTVFGITWGTGIGSGIVIEGKLFRGSGGAGEIGHVPVTTSNQSILCACGKANCLEVYASGGGIQNQYKELGGKISNATTIDIVTSDEVIAIALIDQAVIFMAEAIVAAINIISPDCVILGGGISQVKPQVLEKLKKLVNDQEIRSIKKTEVINKKLQNAALIGAAILARGE